MVRLLGSSVRSRPDRRSAASSGPVPRLAAGSGVRLLRKFLWLCHGPELNMASTSNWSSGLLIGSNKKTVGAAVLVALGGALITSQPLVAHSPPMFVIVLSLFFAASLFISSRGGGLLESLALLLGPALGFYSYNCSAMWAGEVHILPFPELLFTCPVANSPPPALSVVGTISAGIAIPLGAASLVIGKPIHNRRQPS